MAEEKKQKHEPSDSINIMDKNKLEKLRLEQFNTAVKALESLTTRLDRTRAAFLFFNLALLIAFPVVMNFWDFSFTGGWTFIDLRVLPFLLPVTGMFASVTWAALTMRFQMSQRLHYFQLRWLERELGIMDSGIFSQASKYWIGEPLESPDGKEILRYPKDADGQVGGISFRFWGWFLPIWFFLVNLYLLTALYIGLPTLISPGPVQIGM
ncbi:MAG: hypothetical protein GXP49_14710 [Deltaproteobacteria bacterium]|nr:hypothetical protein [Deltaproteobacteria bacterium]